MKAMKILALIGTLALILGGAYGWVMGCCPGVPACGGCHVMNWPRFWTLIVLVVALLIIGLLSAIWWFASGLIHGTRGPFKIPDERSTDNPERDYGGVYCKNGQKVDAK